MVGDAALALDGRRRQRRDHGLQRRKRPTEPADPELPRLVLVKSLCNILQGLAWGCSVPMLHVPGEAVTVIAPAWAMVTGVGVLVFSSAPWPPSTYTFITALFLPSLIYLFPNSDPLAATVGKTMAVCFPFCLLIGRLGARFVGDLVAARLSVTALLERESQLSARLKQMNQERTQFFSSASHDLRQPLQALNFYTNLIGLSPGHAEQRDLLARLADCAEALDRQFNAILGVAAADAAIEQATLRPVLIDPLIRRAMAGHMAEAERKGLRMRAVSTQAAALVAPDALERILSNLIGNAVRCTRAGGVVVGVRRRGGLLAITVADSGIGIAEQDQQRIFDDFFQVANPERDRAKGFGLGLAIVKRLASGFGWPIELSSRLGRGSMFTVLVPCTDATPLSESDEAESGSQPAPVSVLPVIVLDDDGLVRDAMVRLLANWGVEHRACANREELLAMLGATPSRSWCILLDQRLGSGVTGVDVLDEIDRRFPRQHRFLLISGEQDPLLGRLARERQVILLRKPLKPIRLRAALSGLASRLDPEAAV